jgi:hypothetical protein
MTNRRRPWHQRFVRRVTRHLPVKPVMTPSPLSLMSAVTLFGCFIDILSGIFTVALVLIATSIGCLACQLRQHDDLPT